jgi:pimeloyl-[acyl-carrier protein] methyl ester esterase
MTAALHIESSGHGAPAVLLHGWAMHSGVWGDFVQALAKRHRVHAVDLPGHGRSPSLPSFGIAAVIERLDAAFRAERTPIALVGWSLGGLIAMAWSMSHPERVARLVLVSATPRFSAGDGWSCAMSGETLRRFGDELDVAWKATVLRFLTLQMRGSEHGHKALATLRGELFTNGEPSRRTLAQALSVLATTDLRAEVGRIAQPALVINGDRDTLVPSAAGEWLAAALPNGRFAAIAGAAHVPFLSHPAEFGHALREFL